MCVPCSQILKSSFHCPGAGHGCPSPVVFMLLSTPQGLSSLSDLLPCCRAARKLSPDVTFSSWISPSKNKKNKFIFHLNYCMCILLLHKKTKKPQCPGSYSEANSAQLWSPPLFLPFLPCLPLSSVQSREAQAYSSIFPSSMPPSQSLICFSLYQHREPVSNTVPRKKLQKETGWASK